MSTDSRPRGHNLWKLPQLLGVEARHAVYREPRIYWAGTEDKRAGEAVEFLVRTSAGLPIRALSPVLMVGDAAVGECRQEGKNLYRYFAFEIERLRPGAPISLGWPGLPRPRAATRFHYQPDRPPVRMALEQVPGFLSIEAGDSCKPGEGPPAAVPDPDGKGLHPLVLQGVGKKFSRNPTVGDAQEILNRFLSLTKPSFSVCPNSTAAAVDFMTKKRAALAKNGQDPLTVDCRFGENTDLATRMFQTCVGINPDGKIGPVTWANLELLRSRGSLPTFRPCCILAPEVPLSGTNGNLIDPASLGAHGTSSEARGLIYSGKGGFLDLGHIRDHCDETKFVFDQIVALGGALGTVQTANGFATLKKSPSTTAETIRVARAICVDDGLGHEIFSYDLTLPGMHNSSFSPEDLCSNFLGTLLAENAINAGGVFNTAVDAELAKLVRSLDGQTLAETRKAFDLINGRWVDFSGVTSLASFDYLKRRNFEQKPFQAGHSSDAAPPSFVTTPIPDQSAFYDFFYFETRKLLPKTSYAAEIARIRTDAATRYGKDFDKP